MTELTIKFVCPSCKHDHLVEIREDVEMRRLVERVLIADRSPSKHNLLTGEISISDGTIKGYACQACGELIKDERVPNSTTRRWARNRPTASPAINSIHTPYGLIQWLKRHNMITEKDDA